MPMRSIRNKRNPHHFRDLVRQVENGQVDTPSAKPSAPRTHKIKILNLVGYNVDVTSSLNYNDPYAKPDENSSRIRIVCKPL